jgi:hypothetical protein
MDLVWVIVSQIGKKDLEEIEKDCFVKMMTNIVKLALPFALCPSLCF